MEDEKKLIDYPQSVSLESTEKIIDQMKTAICKIYMSDSRATGFFTKIKYNEDKIRPVLITNYHVINESQKQITISINNDQKYINLESKIIYMDKKYDIIIIDIENYKGINNYLEIDMDLFNRNINSYKNESIYLLRCPGGKRVSVSYGIIRGISE